MSGAREFDFAFSETHYNMFPELRRVAHVLQNVGDTNLLVVVGDQACGSAFEEPRAQLDDRMVKDGANSSPPG